MLAKHASPDGTSICPSIDTLAEECGGITLYYLRQILVWLEENGLIERLPDLHPKYHTVQYELRWPDPETIAAGEKSRKLAADKRREATRRRVEKHRQSKQVGDVTQLQSVTGEQCNATEPRSVTKLCEGVTQQCNAVTQLPGVCNAENPPISCPTVPYRPNLDRPIPSHLPFQETGGRMDGALDSENQPLRTSKDLADDIGQWMSDVVYERKVQRYVPSAEDKRRIERIIIDLDPGEVAVTFYRFCLRPLGISNLTDVFGMWWREWEQHLADALDDLSRKPLPEVLSDLHDELFEWEFYLKEQNRRCPSMKCRETIFNLLGVEEAVASADHPEPVCTQNGGSDAAL